MTQTTDSASGPAHVPPPRLGLVRSPPLPDVATVSDRLDLGALLAAAEAAPPAEGVEALAAELAARVGAVEVSLLIADISGLALSRLDRGPAPTRSAAIRPAGEKVPIDGTPAGRALESQQTQVDRDQLGVWVRVPVSQRGEALGVLELLLSEAPDAPVLEHLAAAGHALAYVIIADRRFTDLYERGQRSTLLSLEAEIQRRLLPASYSCAGPQFALAGWLIPPDRAGGDTFDYVLDGDTLHLSITDAIGHGIPAALVATLGIASLRNSRRRGLDLLGQARRASEDVAAHAAPDQFVTALLGRLDVQTGALSLVNAGHMNPLLVRDGQVRELVLQAGLVLGVVPDETYALQHFQLLPGDRLAFVTDGMFERDAAEAEIDTLLGTLGHLHPREAVQVLTTAVLTVTGGAVRDDATVLLVDWYGSSTKAKRTDASLAPYGSSSTSPTSSEPQEETTFGT